MRNLKVRRPIHSVLIHQVDPEHPRLGGIESCVRGIVRHAPPDENILLIGTSSSRPLFRVFEITFEGRNIQFIAVSKLIAAKQKRIIPHSVRMMIGVSPILLSGRIRHSTIHTHRLEMAAWLRLFRLNSYVAFIHTDLTKAIGTHSDSMWKFAPGIYNKMQVFALKGASLCVCLSRTSVERLSKITKSIFFTTSWFDELIFKPRDVTYDFDVIWVGRFEEPKDPLLAVETSKSLLKLMPDAQIVFVGSGTLLKEAKANASEFKNIQFLGEQSHLNLANALARAKVLLLTSHFEGSPVILAEGLACGARVVSVSDADPDMIVERSNRGKVSQSRNPEILARQILDLLDLPRVSNAQVVQPFKSSEVVPKVWDVVKTATSEAIRQPAVLVESTLPLKSQKPTNRNSLGSAS